MSDCPHGDKIGELEAEVERLSGALTDTQRNVVEPLKMQRSSAERERDEIQAQLRDAQEKAKNYDQWFEKGRCPACHFEEKHMVSCPVGMLEGQVAALVKQTLDVLQPILAAPMYVPPELGSTEMRSVGLVDPINKYRRECEAALLSIDLPAASKAILAAAEREPGLRKRLENLEPFVRHNPWCPHANEAYETPCDCGLAEVRAALAGEKETD